MVAAYISVPMLILIKALFGTSVFAKLKYINSTTSFHCPAKKYFSFSPFSVFEKSGPDHLFQNFR
jgi:hypothetical protein